MTSKLIAAATWLRRRAEDIAAVMFMVMFLAFIVQIVTRYVINFPLGWTFELSMLCWVWGVLWGAAFVVRERDEIRFDVGYSLLGNRTRRILTVIAGVALLALYGISLPAVTDYVLFMKVERTAYLKIPFDFAYFVYVIFAVATLVRYAWLIWHALRGEAPETLLDSTRDGPAP
jgi:TRAP-type C4-dicarboxylate transport system permease small subunit